MIKDAVSRVCTRMFPVPVCVSLQHPTGELNYIVLFMCAVLTAKLVGDMMTSSIYDAHAKLNGAFAHTRAFGPERLMVVASGAFWFVANFVGS